ncbi:MAG: DmsE family decaheme c-type cytochrome [Candidatus Rokubacteria bacterium]|nr:DmsE family decaheme c-type cytochrome [Candidatus Rokubacteria bacterium]
MTGRRWRLFAGIASAAAVVCAGIVLGLPFSSRAQQPAQPAAAAAAPADGNYVGAEVCKACHDEAFSKFSKTKMGRLFLLQARSPKEANACETCHGPGKAHVDAGGGKGKGGLITFAKNDKTPVEKRNQVCLGCHTKGARLFWQGSAHESRDVACTNCHKIMEQVSSKAQLAKATEIETCGTCHLQKRAQTMRSSHMPVREGKMTCTSCHNPHGTVTQTLLKEQGVNETCYTCHAEKRGPFLWNHAPVQESCVNCHDPHGSNWERMLKAAKPRLCQQCHSPGSGHPSNMYGRGDTASLKFVMGHQCTNCHALIHGSNHPSGRVFER